MKNLFKRLIILSLSTIFLFGAQVKADEFKYEINELPIEGSKIISETKKSNILYLADKNETADAISGGVKTIEGKGALLLVDSNNLTEDELNIIQNADKLYLLGGEERISKDFESMPNFISRISGKNRYETAVEIAKELGTDRNLIIVNGDNYIDAITTSPMAAQEDRNILLVNNFQIPDATKDYLLKYAVKKDIIFVGGENSIPEKIKREIYDITENPNSISENTISGENRYETCLKIAKRYGNDKNIILSYGNDYYSTLSSINYIDNLNSIPLIVSDDNAEQIINSFYEESEFKNIYSMGFKISESSAENDKEENDIEKDESESQNIENSELSQIDTEEAPGIQNFIDSALSMEGWAYSQSLRMSDGYADCSSLVLKAVIKSGLTDDISTNLTSESIWSDSRFYQISYEDLKPGDICYTYGHLAIYMGDDTVFEAKDWGIPAGYGSFQGRFSSFFRIKGL